MAKRLDIEKVRSALKTAARDAVSGPRELRSGRMVLRDARTGQFLLKEKRGSSEDNNAVEKSSKG